jgi:tape measure domain-containing protein
MAEQLTIRISAQSQEAEAALKRVTQNIQQLSQTARQAGANITRGLSLSSVTAFAERASASLKRLEQNLSQLSSRLAAVSAAWAAATTAFGAGTLKVGMELERLQIQFGIITGSAKEAAKMLDVLRQMSQTSVFDFKVLAEAAAMLGSQIRAAGGDVQQVIPFLQRIQALAVAFGQTTPEALEGIVRAFSQIIAKGRVQMEELMQLSERMIPAQQLLAKGLGLTADQLAKIGEQGIPAAKAINAIFAEAEKQGILKQASEIQTFAAAFSTLRQTVWEAMGRIGLAIGQAVQGPMWELIKRLQELMQSEAFKVFAQRIAEAAANGVRFLTNLVNKIRELMETFRQLPTWAQKGLAALMVNGPIVLAAVAGITKLTSAVLGLVRVLSVDLVIAAGKAAAAIRNITILSWGARAGLIGIMVAAGGLALAHEVQRFQGMAQFQAQQRAGEQQLRQTIQRLTQQPLRVLTPEERQRRLEELNRIVQGGGVDLGQHLFASPKPPTPPKPSPKPPALTPFELKLPAIPMGDKEAEKQRKKAAEEAEKQRKKAAEEAKKQAVDALQDQLHLTQQLIKVEEFRFERLLKAWQLVEAERALRERLLPLLNKQSEIELRLEQIRKGRLTDADKQAQFVERQRKTEELLAHLEDARQRQAEKLIEQARQELAFREEIRREVEAQAEAALRVWEHFQQVNLTLKKLDIADLQDAFEAALSEGRLQAAANLLEQIKTKVNELAQAEIQFRLQQAELQGIVLTEQEKELIQREVMREVIKQVEAATKALQRAEEAAAEAARRHAAERAKLLQTMQQELLTLQERLLRQRLEALPPEMRPQADILETLRQTSLALAKMRADAQLMQDILLDPVAAMIRWGVAIQQAKAEWDEFIAKLQRDAAEVRERVREMMEQAAAERARIPVIMAEAEKERAKAVLETLRAQGATRQQLRQAEIALLQATQKRLEAERASLQALMQQLSVKYAMRFLDLVAAKTQQEAAQALQAMATIERQIAETRAQMVKLDAQILSTQIEIARTNPFEQFRQGIEDAVRRFEDALADWLAGVGRLRDAFRNLWIDFKRQFWRVVVQETLSPLLNWVRAWARQLGEAIFGGILRQPVLTMGLMPTGGGGIGLPLPAIKLPPVAAGAGAAVAAAAMGANKELSALTGAAVGFAVGGPVGAVIGGLAGLLFGGRKKKSAPAPAVPPAIPLGAAIYGPSINLSTAITLQVDGRELGRVMVRQVV